ncbi:MULTISPECIES: glycogen/starch/alpha-glucan phosphorylase [Rhodomicrobium]|uniref:glycogen/starch/alpha-glucan phosphorylase n=1 Tax=Rhodomicrobium TaxID=1068 RepID=UPI000B4BF7C7|nr:MULTISPECIES: glycogen/starch/alpha-glucan phosphorylase [Rhodomicrobium]
MTSLPLPIPAIDPQGFKDEILAKLVFAVGKDPAHASPRDWLIATSLAVRDQLVTRWMDSTRQIYAGAEKRVYYLSMEFLIGRLLIDSLANLGLREICEKALGELGQSLDALKELEPDAALGNGGLGRLAACFLESMGSVGIAGFGYGIRYDHGLFRQVFDEGRQIEMPENWLSFGNPWQFERPEVAYEIGFGGAVAQPAGENASRRAWWHPAERVIAVAFDTPIAGWQGRRVNTLRLWSARSPELMRLDAFNRGDYVDAFAEQTKAESISRVLYPDDSTPIGQELRLKQEYFFTSASLQDLLRRHIDQYGDLASLPDKAAIQLNDTHPALAVPELMRLLVDGHGMAWGEAWRLTQGCIAYTNHTLLPEALESWPVALMERLLPRHMQIVRLIHEDEMAALVGQGIRDEIAAQVALIDDRTQRVRMGNLAFLGAHRVNGVSALHTKLMKQTVFSAQHRLFPDRIVNETNGITPRRWLLESNPGLAALVTEAIGDRWIGDLGQLEALAPMADDAAFRERYAAVKQANKHVLAHVIEAEIGLKVDAGALFDVQIKRIHEYKRQLLNVLEAIAHYHAIRAEPSKDWQPRVKIFGGKAAASYHTAKTIIRLINDAARVINADPVIGDRLKIVFLPDYRVSLAEKIIPAADLSEQISTAGMEASGTGNMKLALNGALTIGTLDGANVEIREHVGAENIFIFGLTADEVLATREGFDPAKAIAASPALRKTFDAIAEGAFSPGEPGRYHGLIEGLIQRDYFLVTADFDAYAAAQGDVDRVYADPATWVRKAILNTAHAGWFSSDRTIRGYASDIWGIPTRDAGEAAR